jgi:DNA-binding Xre family transcriptional regulator
MSNTTSLVGALKRELKSHGMTYREVAGVLGLSEASVKRLFSERDFTLQRLERICRMMDMTIGDLVNLADRDNPYVSELSEDQESELVSDIGLLLVAILVVNRWTFGDVLARYRMSEPELIRYLARLDRLRLIQLLPKNRIKLLIAPNFAWRKNGPIQQYFTNHVKNEFLQSRFDGPGEALMFLFGMLSQRSNAVIQKRLEQVAREFNELNQEDMSLPLESRFGSSVILAIRPWELSAFSSLRRPGIETSAGYD